MYDFGKLLSELGEMAPILILWVFSLMALFGDMVLWKKRASLMNPAVCFVGILLALFSSFNSLGDRGDLLVMSGTILLDKLASSATIALLIAGGLSVLLASTYLKSRDLDRGEYYFFLMISVSGAIIMASANDLVVLFLGLELLSFALYVLAGFARRDTRSEEASLKYFLLGAFASAFLLYGIALVYGATQSTNLTDVSDAIAKAKAVSPMLLGGIALMTVGLAFKAGLVPFHQWTPDVYEGAPTSVTAFMAAAAKIGAFAAIFRVFDAVAPLQAYWLPAIMGIAVLTMVVGNLLAIAQTNVKRLLAYSSVAHAGYLLVAVAAISNKMDGGDMQKAYGLAFSGATFYLFAYTLMTLGAFGVLIYLSHRGKDVQTINDLRGLSRSEPFAAYAMMFFLLSLGGIPPTMGFMGKWQIFMAAVQGGHIVLAAIMALASILAIFYYLRIVIAMIVDEPREHAAVEHHSRSGAYVTVVLALVGTVLFGLAPALLNSVTTYTK